MEILKHESGSKLMLSLKMTHFSFRWEKKAYHSLNTWTPPSIVVPPYMGLNPRPLALHLPLSEGGLPGGPQVAVSLQFPCQPICWLSPSSCSFFWKLSPLAMGTLNSPGSPSISFTVLLSSALWSFFSSHPVKVIPLLFPLYVLLLEDPVHS